MKRHRQGPLDEGPRRVGVQRPGGPQYDAALVAEVLTTAKRDVLLELERLLDDRRRTGYGPLYDLVADYPFREGKGLRPAICLAACRAVGGRTDQALLSAAALGRQWALEQAG